MHPFKQSRGMALVLLWVGANAAMADNFDARSMAMGGTGVSSASLGAAALFNPALLAVPDNGDHFALILPAIGAQATDQGDVRNKVKDLQNGAYDTSVNDYHNFQNTPTSASAAALSTDLQGLNGGLAGLSGQPIDLQAGLVPFSMAFHNPVLSVGVFTNAYADIAARFNYASSDATTLNNYSSLLGSIAPDINRLNSGSETLAQKNALVATLTSPQYSQLINSGCASSLNAGSTSQNVASCFNNPNNTVASSVQAVGAVIGEVGVGLAMQADGIAFGVTPKVLMVKTFYYDKVVQNNTSFSTQNSSKDYNAVNADLGAAYVLPGTPYKVGVVVKNLIPETFSTVTDSLGNRVDIKINPQVSAGAEAHWSRATVTADLDLTRNQAPVPWGQADQFFSLGGELDLWLLQLRAGYRTNLANGPLRNEVSAGVGLGPIDIAATYGAHTVGAVAQLGFSF